MSTIDKARLDETIDQAQKRVAGIHNATETAQKGLQNIIDYWTDDELKAKDVIYVLDKLRNTINRQAVVLIKISEDLKGELW